MSSLQIFELLVILEVFKSFSYVTTFLQWASFSEHSSRFFSRDITPFLSPLQPFSFKSSKELFWREFQQGRGRSLVKMEARNLETDSCGLEIEIPGWKMTTQKKAAEKNGNEKREEGWEGGFCSKRMESKPYGHRTMKQEHLNMKSNRDTYLVQFFSMKFCFYEYRWASSHWKFRKLWKFSKFLMRFHYLKWLKIFQNFLDENFS